MNIETDLPKRLYRYTNLPVLFRLLLQKEIELLNPKTWEDRNDSYFLESYKQEKKLNAVLALCFTTRPETFHHWKVFASGPAGVCIRFDGELLLKQLTDQSDIRSGFVEYQYIKDVHSAVVDIEKWPFIKRKPFADECEYRLVFENAEYKKSTKAFPIELTCIDKVTLSPWLPIPLAKSIKAIISSIPDCDKLKIHRSSLIETPAWLEALNQNHSDDAQNY